MPSTPTYSLTITDSYEDVFELTFAKHEYRSLMDLIANSYPEEFGACKGRGLCGTCHVKISTGKLIETIDTTEKETLKNTYDTDESSRLACQIILDERIHNMTFKIMNNN